MMLHKNSSRASLLKLLALVPIVGIALAMQAETVNDYVYTEKTQTPQKKVVKKGKANAQIKMGNKTIQVKKTEKIASVKTKEPLIMIDGKRSTTAEMDALDEKRIDHINVLKGKAATEIYGAEGKNGVIEIKTKKPVLQDVVVKAKKPQTLEEAAAQGDIAIGAIDYDKPEKPFDVVEQMPEFPGGQEALMQFLRQEVKYPKEAEEKGLQGRVVVRYIIEKDGSISEVEIVKSVNEYLDAEAIRVVNAMPKWKPGKQKGEPVRVKFTLPVTFRLS